MLSLPAQISALRVLLTLPQTLDQSGGKGSVILSPAGGLRAAGLSFTGLPGLDQALIALGYVCPQTLPATLPPILLNLLTALLPPDDLSTDPASSLPRDRRRRRRRAAAPRHENVERSPVRMIERYATIDRSAV